MSGSATRPAAPPHGGRAGEAAEVPGPGLRPYQADAVKSIVAELAGGGRAQARMACGTGKTLVASRVAAELASGGLTVVLAPSIALVAQTLRAWSAGCPVGQALVACSDRTAGHGGVSLAGLTAPVSTDPEFIAKWAAGAGRRALILATFDSAARVAEGLRLAGQVAELVVCDEAHHLAGAAGKFTAAVLRPGFLPARRFLFLTATPRIATGARKGGELAVASMDDEALFGRTAFSYPAGRAIAEGHLKDYRLVVTAFTDASVEALLEGSEASPAGDDVPLRMAAAQAALGMAVAEFGLRRCVAFVPTVADARLFARTLAGTLAMLPAARRPPGPAWAGFVHGKMSTAQREAVLGRLRRPPDGGWSVVANARCLTEGVDIPDIDSVLFASPRDSVVDIVQAAGRPLRLSGQADTAAIIVPANLPDDGTLGAPGSAGPWENVVKVVRALSAHDDRLAAGLAAARAARAAPPGEARGQAAGLPRPVQVRAPAGTAARVLEALCVRVIDGATSSWWEWHALLRQYKQVHGNADVPAGYQAPGGRQLGQWLLDQRRCHGNGTLAPELDAALEELGVTWSVQEAAWQQVLEHAAAYRARFGHLNVPPGWECEDGFPLYWRLTYHSAEFRAGRLAPGRASQFGALGFTVATKAQQAFQNGLDHLDAYIAGHGNARVIHWHAAPDGYRLGNWVAGKRRIRDRLTAAEREALDERGMVWDAGAADREAAYADGLAHLDAYIAEHGHARMARRHAAPDGYQLGRWLHRQADRHRNRERPPLSADEASALAARGVPGITPPAQGAHECPLRLGSTGRRPLTGKA